MLTALLWGLAALVGLVLVALALPIRVVAEARTQPERRLRLKVSMLGGALPLPAITARPPARSPEAAPDRERPARKRRRRGRKRPVERITAIPVRRVLGDLGRGLRLRKLRVDGRIGLGDPAETGQLWGWLAPVLYGLPMPESAEVTLAPAFGGPAMEGTLEAEGEVRLVPLARLCLRVLWALYGPHRGGERAWA